MRASKATTQGVRRNPIVADSSRVRREVPIMSAAQVGKDLSQPDSVRTVFQSAAPKKLKVLIALDRNQPRLIEQHSVFHDPQASSEEIEIFDKLKATKQTREIKFCKPEEVIARLKLANDNKDPYDLVVHEPCFGSASELISQTQTMRECSPRTFVMNYERYQRSDRIEQCKGNGFRTVRMHDLSNIQQLLKSNLLKSSHRVLYIGPKDDQYQRRVLRTATSALSNGFHYDLGFDVINSYNTDEIKKQIQRSINSGKPYTEIVIEENAWNPDELKLAMSIKVRFPAPQVYVFPTQKESREQRYGQLANNWRGVKPLKFDNLALRGKTVADTDLLFDGVVNSPKLDRVIKEAKKAAIEDGHAAHDWSISETINSLYSWRMSWLGSSKTYVVVTKDPVLNFSINNALDCYCSEFFYMSGNGGKAVNCRDTSALKNQLSVFANQGIFPDAIFLDSERSEEYDSVKVLINQYSPHTKLVLFTRTPPPDIQKLTKVELEMHNRLFRDGDVSPEQIASALAEESRMQGKPTLTFSELYRTKFAVTQKSWDAEGKIMDEVLASILDYT